MRERLQKILSQAGIGSRRFSESLIAAGRVTVNGRVAKLGDRADLQIDIVAVDGDPISKATRTTVKLYKPRGVLSSLSDEMNQGRPTVRELVDVPGHLYPVGRLDKQSEGLMLLTNDGALANRLTHPRYRHEKRYHVLIEGMVHEGDLAQWRKGVELDGEFTLPAFIEIVSWQNGVTWLEIRLREGRKRQIRRIAASFGYVVKRLVRVQVGPILLGELQPGEWRHLDPGEEMALVRHVRKKGRPRTMQQPKRP